MYFINVLPTLSLERGGNSANGIFIEIVSKIGRVGLDMTALTSQEDNLEKTTTYSVIKHYIFS